MPRVKVDYVVSFSSEDPEHPASNLLSWEVSKKKWLCKKGESSCSVVLQLTKAVKISSVHIGAYHSALVEVLVARSEKASEQFQVLVPSCVFVPPTESRRDVAVERVRSFTTEQLSADTRDQRWDRVRIVCSQPYNKHCKYGLSFIHIDEAGDSTAIVPQSHTVPTALPQRMLAFDTFSSDEDDFRPGELFAKHLQKSSDSQSSSMSDTGAQIRQASSQALKNISDLSTKLMKTPISKPSGRRDSNTASEGRSNRARDTLMYTDDDERPHAKIDQVVQRHKDHKEKEDKCKPQAKQSKKEKINDTIQKPKDENRTPKRRKSESPPTSKSPPSKKANNSGDTVSSDHRNTDHRTKRTHQNGEDNEQVEAESLEPHELLRGCVLVLSGYENPRRAHVRNTALALGAQVLRDWGPTATHLVCAFPNTPKLRAVRAQDSSTPIVRAEWLTACEARRRRLPWRWFATEPHMRQDEPPSITTTQPASATTEQQSDTDYDTDDEIERALLKRKAVRSSPERESVPPARSRAPPHDSSADVSTDEEAPHEDAPARFGGALPNFFDGHTFAVDASDCDACDITRYVAAYGGLVVQTPHLEADSVEFAIGGAGAGHGATRVSRAWLARCVRAQALLPPD